MNIGFKILQLVIVITIVFGSLKQTMAQKGSLDSVVVYGYPDFGKKDSAALERWIFRYDSKSRKQEKVNLKLDFENKWTVVENTLFYYHDNAFVKKCYTFNENRQANLLSRIDSIVNINDTSKAEFNYTFKPNGNLNSLLRSYFVYNGKGILMYETISGFDTIKQKWFLYSSDSLLITKNKIGRKETRVIYENDGINARKLTPLTTYYNYSSKSPTQIDSITSHWANPRNDKYKMLVSFKYDTQIGRLTRNAKTFEKRKNKRNWTLDDEDSMYYFYNNFGLDSVLQFLYSSGIASRKEVYEWDDSLCVEYYRYTTGTSFHRISYRYNTGINLFDTITYAGNWHDYRPYKRVSWQLLPDGRPKVLKNSNFDSNEDSFRIVDKTYYFYKDKPVKTSYLEKETISVFPNPSNGKINVNLASLDQLLIFDVSGKLILKSGPSLNHSFEIKQKGVFFIKTRTLNKKVIVY